MPLIVGHRGARGLWPENSLAGFRAAAALGVDAIEFDVHAASDGGIAVIHDPTLDRTVNASGPVHVRTLAELQALPLRDADGETVPSLDEVFDALQTTSVELQVEIKTDVVGNRHAGLEKRVVDTIRRHRLQARSVIVSFVPEVLESVLDCWPQARLCASLDRRSAELMGGLGPALDRLKWLPGCVVAIERDLLRRSFAFCLDRLGPTRLGVYTPNEADELAHWMGTPVRHVVTDRPDLARAVRDNSPVQRRVVA